MFKQLRPWGSLAPYGSLSNAAPPANLPSTIRDAVYYLLSHDAGITSIVGERVYPAGLPQKSYQLPALTTVVAGTFEPATLAGATPTRKTSVRISCWSRSPEEADQLANAVRLCLMDYRGDVGSVRLSRVACDGEFDQPEKPSGGNDKWIYQIILNMKFWHRSL